MTGPTAAHLTSAVAIIGGGMLAGHVLAPYGAGAGLDRRVFFAVIMLLLGAWRGRSEWRARAEWNGVLVGTGPSTQPIARAAAVGAVSALAVAAAGYWVAHG